MVLKPRASDSFAVVFFQLLSFEEKVKLLSTMKEDRGSHVVKPLPLTVGELSISPSVVKTTVFDDSFLDVAVQEWPEWQSYNTACEFINNLPCDKCLLSVVSH